MLLALYRNLKKRLGEIWLTSRPHLQTTNNKEERKFPLINLRQLDCLAKGSCDSLSGFFDNHLPKETSQCLAVVLTHDCSISGELLEKEPYLEILCAKIVLSKDGRLTHGKNPRKLHVQVEHNDNGEKWLEINICHREFLPKKLFDGQVKSVEWSFSEDNKELIRRWLAARYQAPAYPDQYEARLKINKANEKIEKILARMGGYNIDGLFMVLSPREEELTNGQPYELELMLMVKSGLSAKERKEIEEIRDDLVKEFREAKGNGLHLVGDNDNLTTEEASQLIPIRSDDEITVSEYRQYDKMRLDHLSEGLHTEINPRRPVNK